MPDDSIDLTGDGGQLIRRLRDAINELGTRVPDAPTLPLLGIQIDLHVPEHPHTDTAQQTFALIESRSWELIRAGISESLLVAAIRDRVSEILRGQADDLGKVNERRRAVQHGLLDLLSDPPRFRAWANDKNPGCEEASWTDEQVAAERQVQAASPRYAELGIEQASSAWAAQAAWANIAADRLSDAHFERWRQQWMMSEAFRRMQPPG